MTVLHGSNHKISTDSVNKHDEDICIDRCQLLPELGHTYKIEVPHSIHASISTIYSNTRMLKNNVQIGVKKEQEWEAQKKIWNHPKVSRFFQIWEFYLPFLRLNFTYICDNGKGVVYSGGVGREPKSRDGSFCCQKNKRS